tara:strand:- start:36 stop:1010 length:975 start_codon:yes stop_codon:yes gene_type:complete
MLSANKGLTIRDVQHILVNSSSVSPSDLSFDWQKNGAGRWTHHHLGFGMVSTGDAVALARDFTPLQPRLEDGQYRCILPKAVANDATATHYEFMVASTLTLEHVVLQLSLTHSHPGDVEVSITSPSGLVTQLMRRHGYTRRRLTLGFTPALSSKEYAAPVVTEAYFGRPFADNRDFTIVPAGGVAGCRLSDLKRLHLSSTDMVLLPKAMGSCSVEEQVYNAMQAGAGAAAVERESEDAMRGLAAGEAITIPSLGVSTGLYNAMATAAGNTMVNVRFADVDKVQTSGYDKVVNYIFTYVYSYRSSLTLFLSYAVGDEYSAALGRK